ncbi:hypothetical protein J7T55_012264 [Diaporthe amygdali]|uniref:uncharacterized protein n=1 Tax=Phomopsis amygdali TaxID=1214568 RepID=UPI0022FE50F1|nr:uncharacterized protein J7T55_012264 [Diaporthe amygdali]KAJ0123795.1 hypothetical protein J7T55_012264 [Diaporthe amygdali]
MASSLPVFDASYWQYKEDTSYVLKWIDQAARSYGWKRRQTKHVGPKLSNAMTTTTTSAASNKFPGMKTSTATGPGRLKGKDRRAAKQQVAAQREAALEKEKKEEYERGIVLSTAEILEQADLISARLPVSDRGMSQPPSSVIHALSRAIRLRRRFSNWFEAAQPDDRKSNSAHRYFVEVLERLARLFVQTSKNSTIGSDQTNSEEVASGNGRRKPENHNRYEVLLEKMIQDEPEHGPESSAKSSGPSMAKEPAKSARYHMEVDDCQENAFMVFTLFMDLQDLKAEIRRLWERSFKDGADLSVATLMTAQALAFVKRSEEKIVSILPSPRYEGDLERRTWSHPGTYCRLLNTLHDPTDIKAVIGFEESNYTSANGGEQISMNDLTFVFSVRRLVCTSVSEDFPPFNPLIQEFVHNPRVLLRDDIDMVLERDRTLCFLLYNLKQLHRFFTPPLGSSERARQLELYSRDPIMDSLQSIWVQKEVNLTSVFAAEIMLDIKETCDAFPASIPNYFKIYDRYMKLLGIERDKESFSFTPGTPLCSFMDSGFLRDQIGDVLTKSSYLLLNITRCRFDTSQVHPRREGVGEICKHLLDLYTGLEQQLPECDVKFYRGRGVFEPICFPKDEDLCLGDYPLLSTMRETFLATLSESIGIEMLNDDRHATSAMAHVYNASRQLGIGNLHWPAMDRLIELHKIALFAGDIPNTPAAMLQSFRHRNWGPEGKMSRKERKRRMNRTATLMRPSATTLAFNEHLDTAGRIPFTYTLESNAIASMVEKKLVRNNSSSVAPSFIESMATMENYLTKQFRDVRVDYMEVIKVSLDFNDDLLEHARKTFAKQANWIIGDEKGDGWSGIDFVSEAFEQEAALAEAMTKCDGDSSKFPAQDCDYLQDSVNCLANSLRAKGIGGPSAPDEEAACVNMPSSQKRFRLRDSQDGPDLSPLVLVSYCRCCHRKHHY